VKGAEGAGTAVVETALDLDDVKADDAEELSFGVTTVGAFCLATTEDKGCFCFVNQTI
jgi:hypothetical protein